MKPSKMIRAVSVLMLIAYACDRQESPSPNLRSIIECGQVVSGSTISKTFTAVNRTSGSLRLNASTSCGCTSVALGQLELKAGESIDVPVKVDTSKKHHSERSFKDLVTITGSSKDSTVILQQVSVVGEIMPSLQFGTDNELLRVDAQGESAPTIDVPVVNNSDQAIEVSSIVANPWLYETKNAKRLIPAGSTAIFQLTPTGKNDSSYPKIDVDVNSHLAATKEPLRHTTKILLIKRSTVAPIPGSIIFSESDKAKRTAKSVTLVADDDVTFSIADSKCSSTAIDVKLIENSHRFEVSLSESIRPGAYEIVLQCKIGETTVPIKVPIIVP